MEQQRAGQVVAAAGAAGALLLLAAPAPTSALELLREPPAGDPVAPLVGLLSLLAWLLAGWLLLGVSMTAGAHLPGGVGRLASAAARAVVPTALRRAVELALGLTVLVGATASPAAASSATAPSAPPPPAAAAVTDLDWGAPLPEEPAPPAADAPPPPPARAAPARPAQAAVLVRPGDTLWALAAQELGGAATDRAIAQRWPAWWQANRDVLGSDPDLLVPGQQLTPPS